MENENGEREQVAKEAAERRLTRLFSLANSPRPEQKPVEQKETNKKRKKRRNDKLLLESLKDKALKMERAKKRKENKEKKNKERLKQWITGTYQTEGQQVDARPSETVEQYLNKGGAITLLKPSTEAEQKRLKFLRMKRRLMKQGKWRSES